MLTPAITASSVSAPARIISIALSVARNPLALETTSGREPFDCSRPGALGLIPAAMPATRLLRIKSLRSSLVFICPPHIAVSKNSILFLTIDRYILPDLCRIIPCLLLIPRNLCYFNLSIQHFVVSLCNRSSPAKGQEKEGAFMRVDRTWTITFDEPEQERIKAEVASLDLPTDWGRPLVLRIIG